MSELIRARIPNLGFGNMRMPKNPDGTPDRETIFRMIDTFMDAGFNYFDTAYIYPGSEEMLRIGLVERYPRDRFFITTKLHLGECHKAEDMMKQFNTSRERLGVEVVDMYFLHGVGESSDEKIDRFHAFDFLRSLRDQGLVKHIGFSFHGKADYLEQLLTDNPDMELVQLQLNYLDWEDGKVQARLNYETARRHGKPISVMEPCKGGMLSGDEMAGAEILKGANPDVSLASWAFRFVAGLEGIYAILSGMSCVEQVEDNVKTFRTFTPLTEEERALTLKVVEAINAVPGVPCTGCEYCKNACPLDMNIPFFLRAYNNLQRFHNLEISRHVYKMMIMSIRKASECIECHSCEQRCPQHIEITKYLKEVVKELEVAE